MEDWEWFVGDHMSVKCSFRLGHHIRAGRVLGRLSYRDSFKSICISIYDKKDVQKVG